MLCQHVSLASQPRHAGRPRSMRTRHMGQPRRPFYSHTGPARPMWPCLPGAAHPTTLHATGPQAPSIPQVGPSRTSRCSPTPQKKNQDAHRTVNSVERSHPRATPRRAPQQPRAPRGTSRGHSTAPCGQEAPLHLHPCQEQQPDGLATSLHAGHGKGRDLSCP